MFQNHLKIAWRNLKKHKVFSFINVFGLSAGLASCMLICLYIYHELSYDLHHKNIEQLYQVGTVFVREDGEQKVPNTPGALAKAVRDEFPEVVNTARLAGLFVDDKTLFRCEGENGPETFYETHGYLADTSFFSFFNYDFIEGDKGNALRNPKSIVLSAEIAQKIFGVEPALNKVIHVESNTNGDGDYLVTGVFKPSTMPSHIDARFFMSYIGGGLEEYINSQTSMSGNNLFYTYIQLEEGATPQQMEAKFPAFVDKYMGKDLKAAGFGKKQFLLPVKDIHLKSGMDYNVTASGNMSYLYVLISIALFILLIACINFMNLSTARSSTRTGEVGIRKVLGAQRNGLVYQYLSESLLMTSVAFVFAILFVRMILPVFENVSEKTFSFSLPQYGYLLASFLLLSILTGLLAGSYPAFYLSSFNPIKVLKGRLENTLSAVFLRKGLVVFQFIIAVVLIAASVVIYKQMDFLRSTDLGFAKDQQIVIPLRSETAKGSYSAFKNMLASTKEVQSVGASAYYPGIFNPEDANFYRDGQTMNDAKHTYTNRVDLTYLPTLGIKPVAGRIFAEQFADSSSMVLNETAVRSIGFATPAEAIGKKIYTEREGQRFDYTVVGVVKDFHFEDLKTPISPFGFELNQGTNYNYLIAHAKAADIAKVLGSIEVAWQALNPNEPFEYSFLDEDFQKNYKAENRLATVVGYFTLMAVLISCLGLFGLAMFTAQRRVKEIGVRKVLGASMASIVGLLTKEFLSLVVIALVIASPLAYFFMNKWLQDFAYRIDIHWSVFALAGLAAVAVAFLTVSFQSVKAALANPVKSLRSE
ncbi:MAG: ABC transporter permease [Saprospiraceae bacterium]|nr:ABC transporter permease [Saprospiraceae bacterium]